VVVELYEEEVYGEEFVRGMIWDANGEWSAARGETGPKDS
jgi:hypothetical protein